MFERKKKHCISWCGPTDSHRFETMDEGGDERVWRRRIDVL
jgi:hypothetical protein